MLREVIPWCFQGRHLFLIIAFLSLANRHDCYTLGMRSLWPKKQNLIHYHRALPMIVSSHQSVWCVMGWRENLLNDKIVYSPKPTGLSINAWGQWLGLWVTLDRQCTVKQSEGDSRVEQVLSCEWERQTVYSRPRLRKIMSKPKATTWEQISKVKSWKR